MKLIKNRIKMFEQFIQNPKDPKEINPKDPKKKNKNQSKEEEEIDEAEEDELEKDELEKDESSGDDEKDILDEINEYFKKKLKNKIR